MIRMMGLTTRVVGGLVVVAGLGSAGWFGYRTWHGSDTPPAYKTVEVKRGNVVSTVSATGTLEPLVKVLVGSQISGTVTRWYADFNQHVEEGFVLAELDQERYKAQLEQRNAAVAVARARVDEAKANLATATFDRQRIETAFAREAASDFELQSARANEAAVLAQLHAAEAQLLADEADANSAEVDLSRTIIRSPIDGVVISRDVDAGQTVAASLSAPTLFTIGNDLTKMRVNAAVNETDIGKVVEGMPAEFRVDAFPARRYRGTVSQVRYAEKVVDNVVTYTTLIDVDNPDLSLRPGMTATILFEVAKAEDVLTVPNAALRFNPEAVASAAQIDWRHPGRGRPMQSRVFRLKDGALEEVPLELGLNDGTFTEVKVGTLSEGDQVVTEQQLTRGARPPAQRMPRM